MKASEFIFWQIIRRRAYEFYFFNWFYSFVIRGGGVVNLLISYIFCVANIFALLVINVFDLTKTEGTELIILQVFFLFMQILFGAVHWYREWR